MTFETVQDAKDKELDYLMYVIERCFYEALNEGNVKWVEDLAVEIQKYLDKQGYTRPLLEEMKE